MLEQEVPAYDYEDARMAVSELAEKTGKCDCRHSELNTTLEHLVYSPTGSMNVVCVGD